MKIGPVENKPHVAPASGERAATRPGQGASEEASAQVALSPAASQLAADPDFDADKVMRIAQAIRDGRFTVDAHAIADKLIANARELLGGGGKH
jgi:negative regulator of flagellin synthesis FlgM